MVGDFCSFRFSALTAALALTMATILHLRFSRFLICVYNIIHPQSNEHDNLLSHLLSDAVHAHKSRYPYILESTLFDFGSFILFPSFLSHSAGSNGIIPLQGKKVISEKNTLLSTE